MCLWFIYFCIRSLVRHLPNTSTGCFRLVLFGKPRHWGQSESSSLIGWFVDMVYFQQWSRKRPCDVTREILLNIIHTHQIKIRQKKLRNLFTPSAIFFVTKFHVFVIIWKLPAKYFHHINETEPFSVFVNGIVWQFCIKRTVAMMAQRGVSLNVT